MKSATSLDSFEDEMPFSTESGYSSSDGSGHSSPSPIESSLTGSTYSVTDLLIVLPPGFRIELVPVQMDYHVDGALSANDDIAVSDLHNEVTPQRRLVKWSLPPPLPRAVPLPGWTPMPFGLETFWQSAFAWFFRPFWVSEPHHLWTLEPVELPPVSADWPWHTASYTAKVRFLCPKKHGWTSLKGRVDFFYRVRRQGEEIVCEALFKTYGQQCNRCHHQGLIDQNQYLPPLWYPDEIENAIRSLSIAVTAQYYGGEEGLTVRRTRQAQRPSRCTRAAAHHDPTRCQACREGLCVLNCY